MLEYISPITNYIEEFCDRPNFINQYNKLVLCSNNLFCYCNPPKKYFRQIYLIREL